MNNASVGPRRISVLTDAVRASLNQRSIIDRHETTIEGTVGLNRAPTMAIEPASQSVARTAAVRFTVTASDDGCR